jgi:hypothetical protein
MRILTFDLFEATKPSGPKPLTSTQKQFLDRYTEGSWSWNPETGKVDVEGNFDMGNKRLKSFRGVSFGSISGNFDCHYNQLASLEGAPQQVGGDVFFGNNRLTSLVGGPKEVGGDFMCFSNRLTSLEGAPEKVGGNFDCRVNILTSLEGAPKEVGGDFKCYVFELDDWSITGFLNLLNGKGKVRDKDDTKKLILPLLNELSLDSHFKKNPLDLDLLDEFPEIKMGVLARTGIKDVSGATALFRKGLF